MIKKILIWFFIGLLILVLFITGFGLVVGYFYADKVESAVISELNKYVKTEISVSNIEFSVFSKFPDASLKLSDVFAKSTDEFNRQHFKNISTDTLFTASSLYLQFNIFDIIAENYRLKSIEVENGNLNIFIDKNGADNYHFIVEDTSGEESSLKIELQRLFFDKIYLKVFNRAANLRLRTYTENVVLAGDLTSDSYSLNTNGKFRIDELFYDDINYFSTRNVYLDLNLQVDNNRYTIKKGTLNVENLAFAISGRVVSGEPYSVNLDIKGKDLNVKSFVSLLPDAYKEDIADYSSNGIFYMNATVSGNVDRNSMPHISLDFGVEDGIIERNGTELRLNNVFVTGNFSNGDKNNSSTSTLVFENFDILMGRSHLEGRYKMENFKKPSVTLQASGEIEMEQVKEFFDIDTLQLFSGLITADILFEGQLNSLEEFTVQDFRNAKTEGKIRITDGKLKIENNPYNFNEINGRFTFKNNDIRIDSLICIINDNDFLITGYFKNILSFLMVEGQELSIDGKISSSNLDVVKLFNLDEQAGEDNDGYHFPDNIRVNAQVDIRNFRYRRFEATGVFGKVQYMNKTLAVSPVTFSTMDGKLKTTGTIAQEKDNSFTTKCYTVLTGIDIKKLFWTFRNFDQDFILDSHLKGSIFADLSYSSAWDSTLSVDEKSIVAEGEIIIDNGELIGFEPMEKLSKFIALDELMHIKFETLKNDIIIKDRKVTIPQMNIKSSAFDIELSGEHTFDNDINYKIKVLLSDILARKAKKAKKENEEFGQIEDDGLGRTSIYISITGNVDDYKVSYDTKKVKDHIKESLKEEKNNLKQILNEEFGWFKKDSAVIKNKDPEQDNNSNNNFTIRWDEDEDEENNNGNTEEEDDDW